MINQEEQSEGLSSYLGKFLLTRMNELSVKI